jgi:hypothetical protein
MMEGSVEAYFAPRWLFMPLRSNSRSRLEGLPLARSRQWIVLHTARRRRFNGVARLESITRVVSFEKEKVLRLARQVDPMPKK